MKALLDFMVTFLIKYNARTSVPKTNNVKPITMLALNLTILPIQLGIGISFSIFSEIV